MKTQIKMPPYETAESKARVALPVTMVIVGASLMVMAVMMMTKDKSKRGENGSYEVENYDVVGNNIPLIYSICE